MSRAYRAYHFGLLPHADGWTGVQDAGGFGHPPWQRRLWGTSEAAWLRSSQAGEEVPGRPQILFEFICPRRLLFLLLPTRRAPFRAPPRFFDEHLSFHDRNINSPQGKGSEKPLIQ